MNIAIILAALTALSTFAGGPLALKAKVRFPLVLGFSAEFYLVLLLLIFCPKFLNSELKSFSMPQLFQSL